MDLLTENSKSLKLWYLKFTQTPGNLFLLDNIYAFFKLSN